MKAWKAELLLVLITFIWGGTFLFTKMGLQDCPPSLYIIFRFLIALSVSLIFFGRHLKGMDRKTLFQGLLLGVFFGCGFILQTYGLKYTEVSKSAFITGLAVPLVPFVYWMVSRKSVKIWPKIGVVIATFGLWLFADPNFDEINIGDVYTLFSTIFWALYITYMDIFTKGRFRFAETAQLVMLQFIAAAPVSFIFFLIFELEGLNVNFSTNLISSLLYNAFLASFMVTFIHTSVQRYTTPVKASLIFALEPIIASLVAIIAINEILSGKEYIGAAILLLGILTSELGGFFYNKIKFKFFS